MKAETFSPEVFPEFMIAFKSLVRSNMSSDVLRSLSLFITYTLHKSDRQSTRTLRSRKSTLQIRQKATTSPARPGTAAQPPSSGLPQLSTNTSGLSRTQIGVKVLEMYSELLCEETGTTNIKKFARTVTNKVCRAVNCSNHNPNLISFSGCYISSQRMTHALLS
jgi:beige protein homolog 1